MHVETRKANVGFGQAGVRGGIGRLSGDGQIEVLDGLPQALLCSLVRVEAAQEKQSMCFWVDRTDARQTRLFLGRQGDPDFAGDALGHFALQGQDVPQVTLVTSRPQRFFRGGPDQPGRDSHLVARADHRAFDDAVDIQFPRDGWERLACLLVLHHRGARDHAKRRD